MLQDILTWIIVGVCVAAAAGMIFRRLRGRGKNACNCGCGEGSGGKENCTPSTDVCGGCPLSELCQKPEKK